MVGTTLRELRDRIDDLATEDGPYRLVCARTGVRPVPADAKRFPDRETADCAASATEQYRAALRRYDPRAPFYDVIACEATDGVATSGHSRCPGDDQWSLSEPVLAGGPTASEHRRRVSFCHDVAAATFEALSASGYDAVESAVMDAYFDLAERVPDPDELCLRLLESIAGELDDSLEPAAQRTVIADGANRLGRIDGDGDPIDAVFEEFQALGMVAGFSHPVPSASGGRPQTVVVEVEGYALAPTRERLPILPIVLDFQRRRFERPIASVTATAIGDGWRVTFEVGTDHDPGSLACALIEDGSQSGRRS